MGLYNQTMAIQWIKDNIQFFGGNPNSITIFGESAGAASISAHLLSPVSRHLMKRVILQSGVVNAPWSYATAEKSKELSLTLAKKIGCSSVTSRNNHLILQCFKNNIEKLYATAGLSFTPTVSLIILILLTFVLGTIPLFLGLGVFIAKLGEVFRAKFLIFGIEKIFKTFFSIIIVYYLQYKNCILNDFHLFVSSGIFLLLGFNIVI